MKTPLEIIDDAIKEYDPKYVIGMFSGGHDSLVATHTAMQHPRFSFAAHINTGIGIEETRQFVRDTCGEWGIGLKEYKASEYIGRNDEPKPQIYEDLVLEYGFPGPPMHTKMYNRLKERPLRHMIRDLDRNRRDKTLLITGVRADESTRRMKHVEPVQVWEGTKVWVASIWNFSKKDVYAYIKKHDLKRNLVADTLHMSGECLCGAFAHPGEREEIRIFYPGAAAYLDELEEKVRAKGFPWSWGTRAPKWWLDANSGKTPHEELDDDQHSQMLCVSCSNKYSKIKE